MPAQNQDRRIMQDVTVLAVDPDSGGVISVLGQIESVDITLKREFVDVTASADQGKSSRSVRWGDGSVKLTGFSAGTSSLFAQAFAAGSHGTFVFTEAASGDSYQLNVRMEDYSKSLGKDATKDTLTLTQEGVPQIGFSGGGVAPMTLLN